MDKKQTKNDSVCPEFSEKEWMALYMSACGAKMGLRNHFALRRARIKLGHKISGVHEWQLLAYEWLGRKSKEEISALRMSLKYKVNTRVSDTIIWPAVLAIFVSVLIVIVPLRSDASWRSLVVEALSQYSESENLHALYDALIEGVSVSLAISDIIDIIIFSFIFISLFIGAIVASDTRQAFLNACIDVINGFNQEPQNIAHSYEGQVNISEPANTYANVSITQPDIKVTVSAERITSQDAIQGKAMTDNAKRTNRKKKG